ncbi:VENN motif pre-toxin domain-containing protein [Avibacterium avium]|uniref:VENN motif pre-toxin domain-containing protein n=1 Tax=Avibacterium avium TaxID=751 RepID=UPI003BF78FEF
MLEADRLQQEIAQEQSKPQAMQDKQKIAEKTTALANTLERQEKWSEKGEYKRNLDNLTTIAGGMLAGQSGTQIATTLASPTLNEKIKALTTDSNGEVNLLTNTLAHAMLGAVEAAAAKGNITAGALAASASELAAPAITKVLGKDNPNQLSAEERQTVTALSALAGSLTAGLTAQQNGSATNTVSTLNAMALGGEIGKRAVENNYVALVARGCTAIPSCRNKVAKEIIEYSVKAGITGVIANEIVENISQEDAEHLITLSLMGNDEVTQKYLNYLTVKYSHSEIKLPSHTGGHQLENKPIQTHTGGNQIIDNGLPNNTGGIPIDVNIPSHTDGSPILEQDKTGHILSGSEVQVGDWKENILHSTNYIDKPKQKVNSASVGDIIRTPTTHPG